MPGLFFGYHYVGTTRVKEQNLQHPRHLHSANGPGSGLAGISHQGRSP